MKKFNKRIGRISKSVMYNLYRRCVSTGALLRNNLTVMFNTSQWGYRKTKIKIGRLVSLVINYPTPINLNFFWNFGSLILFGLVLQITSGIFLAFWYVPSSELAFQSIDNIMREVNNGWLMRYIHSNGASLIFFTMYIHIFKNIYYGSYVYPRTKVWYSGFGLFVLMIATAFFGYVLPWGQMSYWAATVITSLCSAVPVIGPDIVTFIWGGLSVDQPTLTRIFGLHFILPFIIIGITGLHIFLLHQVGSNNPLGIKSVDNVPFFPYYFSKDIVGILIASIIFAVIVFFHPDLFVHPDNFVPADPTVTPAHIVPEWYFLPFYGILRSVPSKIGGIALLALALLCICFLPLITKQTVIRSAIFRPMYRIAFFVFVVDTVLLGWAASQPVEQPYYQICQITTVVFFTYFFILPVICLIERKKINDHFTKY